MHAGCKIEGCSRTGKLSRGWCQRHYQRWYRFGDPRVVESSIPHYEAPGVDDRRLAEAKTVAGDGDLDERCSRLLAHFRWFDPPHEKEHR